MRAGWNRVREVEEALLQTVMSGAVRLMAVRAVPVRLPHVSSV